jgi:hypothetical protein
MDGEQVETVMVGDDSVLLDLKGNFVISNSGRSPSQAGNGGGGGGSGCFVTSTVTAFDPTAAMALIVIFFSISLIGQAVFALKKNRK